MTKRHRLAPFSLEPLPEFAPIRTGIRARKVAHSNLEPAFLLDWILNFRLDVSLQGMIR